MNSAPFGRTIFCDISEQMTFRIAKTFVIITSFVRKSLYR